MDPDPDVEPLWFADEEGVPTVSRGQHQTFAYSPTRPNCAVITTRLRADELHPNERLPAIASLLHSLAYRIRQVEPQSFSVEEDLVRCYEQSLHVIQSGRPILAAVMIDGSPSWATSWNHGRYRSVYTIHQQRWVSVLLVAGNAVVQLANPTTTFPR